MAKLILLNKPFRVLSQFTQGKGAEQERKTLSDCIPTASFPGFYPAGRLDFDSEGLLLLTDNGGLQHRIAHPTQKLEKVYWVQVEGDATGAAIENLCRGVELKDGHTLPAKVRKIDAPELWSRVPPIRQRESIPTSWLEICIREGKNRQVRRMTAAVKLPTLRLVRVAIGEWRLNGLAPGDYRVETVHVVQNRPKAKNSKTRRTAKIKTPDQRIN